MPRKIRVLIVDDSALVRSILARGLAADEGIEVVGTAGDPYEARDILVRQRPDVMTLDVEMPRMDGISFLKKVMAVLPTPTVIVSSLTMSGSSLALEALASGAVDVIAKPSAGIVDGLGMMMASLVERVKVAASSRCVATGALPAVSDATDTATRMKTTDSVIGIGASTGGVAALGRILPALPPWSPGLVIVQHMPAGFTADFALRLDGMCAVRVTEAKHGDRVLPGHVLVAPGGDRHLEVRRYGTEYRVFLERGAAVSGHTPSVDVFFASLATHVRENAAACLLTGMGADGANGLLALRLSGGRTFVQDQETSVVWGMPRAAVEIGAAERALPLEAIPAAMVHAIRTRPPPSRFRAA
jgi:two-component system chemotaxis response regulator CheB